MSYNIIYPCTNTHSCYIYIYIQYKAHKTEKKLDCTMKFYGITNCESIFMKHSVLVKYVIKNLIDACLTFNVIINDAKSWSLNENVAQPSVKSQYSFMPQQPAAIPFTNKHCGSNTPNFDIRMQ